MSRVQKSEEGKVTGDRGAPLRGEKSVGEDNIARCGQEQKIAEQDKSEVPKQVKVAKVG